MEFWELPKDEKEKYLNLSDEDLKNILTEGVKSEFWKYLRACMAVTMETAQKHLLRRHIDSMDSCISLSKWNAVYKTAEEYFNTPEHILRSIIKKQNAKK